MFFSSALSYLLFNPYIKFLTLNNYIFFIILLCKFKHSKVTRTLPVHLPHRFYHQHFIVFMSYQSLQLPINLSLKNYIFSFQKSYLFSSLLLFILTRSLLFANLCDYDHLSLILYIDHLYPISENEKINNHWPSKPISVVPAKFQPQ